MKVLITHLTFGRDVFGGVERATFNLCLGLSTIGHEVVVYTSKKYVGDIDRTIIDGVRVVSSPHLKANFEGPTHLINEAILTDYRQHRREIVVEFLALMARERPDYILAVDHLWGIVPHIAAWEHFSCASGLLYHMAYEPMILEKTAAQPFTHLWSVSPYLTKTLRRMCTALTKKDIGILPNSIDTKDFHLGAVDHPTEACTVFCNARLGPEKGVLYLVRALPMVVAQGVDAKIYFCGGAFHFGDSSAVIAEIQGFLATCPGIRDRIEILPSLQWGEVAQYLSRADIVVLPTQDETFGMAALEAMAAGVPLVASRVGNLSELVQDAGVLVPPGDSGALASAIVATIRDREATERRVHKGIELARHYDCRAIARRFVGAIRGHL